MWRILERFSSFFLFFLSFFFFSFSFFFFFHSFSSFLSFSFSFLLDQDDDDETLAKTVSDFHETELKIYYIWLAGTLEEYRQFHLMRRLFEEVVTVAESKGYNALALKTQKKRFPLMYEWCARTDWLHYEEDDDNTVFYKIL